MEVEPGVQIPDRENTAAFDMLQVIFKKTE